jgi:recombination protein RecT
MPKHMSGERLYQLAVSAINTTPKLAECSPQSLLSCVMKCSALGLEPSAVDGLGRCYILPYRNAKTQGYEATFIIGYKGLIDLARNSGKIKSISAHPVYAGDDFHYEFGLHEDLRHVPMDACDKTDANLTHVYAVAQFTDGGHQIDVMTKAEVDAIRKRSKASNNGPWATDYAAMAVKTVIRRASKTWPMSTQAREAVAADETTGGYEAMLTHDDVIPADAFDSAEEAVADGD